MQATSLAELAVLNPLTRLKQLSLETSLADGRLDQLNLGANVMVSTLGFMLYRGHTWSCGASTSRLDTIRLQLCKRAASHRHSATTGYGAIAIISRT